MRNQAGDLGVAERVTPTDGRSSKRPDADDVGLTITPPAEDDGDCHDEIRDHQRSASIRAGR